MEGVEWPGLPRLDPPLVSSSAAAGQLARAKKTRLRASLRRASWNELSASWNDLSASYKSTAKSTVIVPPPRLHRTTVAERLWLNMSAGAFWLDVFAGALTYARKTGF